MRNCIKYPKGSEWRKWDLHFHTPSSYDYKNKGISNKDIIDQLSDSGVSVIAITDHHIIDIDRIKKLQKLGEEKQIIVLPGIEFCSNSRGKEPIHFIGIFSENLDDLDYIWTEINSKAEIAKQRKAGKSNNEIYCKLDETCKLIHDLGGIITIHAGSKSNTLENITNSLPIGMAEKKDLSENIDIFELGKVKDIRSYQEKVFPAIGVIKPTIICSDNHNIKNYAIKENLWIKANPTFEGLKQIIFEPKFGERVLIGKEPEVFERINNNKTKYLNSLHISQISNYDEKKGIWFKDINIDLNSELVAIIGNKGSGKSAIVDILGLLGNTYNAGKKKNNFSFLNKEKFLKKGVGKNFKATLEWKSGSDLPINLYSDIIENEPEKVRYLPQNYFENLTNDLSGEGFKETLENVIFEHLTENYSKSNFKELKHYKSKSIEKDISLIKDEIKTLNSEIINLEQQNHPDYLQEISNKLEEKQKELDEHKKILKEISIVKNPEEDKDSQEEKTQKFKEIKKLNNDVQALSKQIKLKTEEKEGLLLEIEDLQQISDDLKRLENQTTNYIKKQKSIFEKYDLDIDDIIKIRIKHNLIKDKITDRKDKLKNINNLLTSTDDIEAFYTPPEDDEIKSKSLFYKMKILKEKIEDIKKVLSKKEKQYQEYIETINRWKKRESRIVGTNDTTGSLVFLKEKLNFINNELKDVLENKKEKRIKKALEIYKKKSEIINLYKKFKEPVDKKVQENAEFLIDYEINIEASFELDVDFHKKFLNHISQNKRGSFLGIVEGEANLNEIIIDKNLNEKDDIELILNEIFKYLMIDQRKDSKGKDRFIKDQVIDKQVFYDFVFELDYLKPIYELKLGDKQLSELSPGEKGTLLLIFYLMIDKEEIPLIIDQPEDNLDNKSVYIMLTKFIKLAKEQRQIIIVTHNPNLAVGADAEQIIHVHIDKKNKNEFSFISGAIEDSEINHLIVDILEGTMPAFDKRKLKYYK